MTGDADLPAFMDWTPPPPDFLDDCQKRRAYPFIEWSGDRCCICGEVPERSLHTDHDHATLLVRGRLCRRCNMREPFESDARMEHWRAGMNPCAMFGWHYRWGGSSGIFPITQRQATWLTRRSLLAEMAAQGISPGALALSGGFYDSAQ